MGGVSRPLSFVLSLAFACAMSSPAHADPAPPPSAANTTLAVPSLAPLLGKLGAHGERIEEMKKRGSYTLSGRIEQLDGDGAIDSWKNLVLRVTATGESTPRSEVVSYVEDGEDKTADAKKRAADRAKKKIDKKREFRVPFLPSEQPKYDFRVVGVDSKTPELIKIAFSAKTPSDDTWNGTAWVHQQDGEIERMTFGFSKRPTFVDEAEATLVFGTRTALGRAPSELRFDAKGGFLFIRRHYRGHATLTNAVLGKG